MKFLETAIIDAYVIEIEEINDERGFFSRAWDKKIFEEKKLNSNLVQCNISFNKKKGTLRGLHYQEKPFEEAKLVRCTNGSVYEVIVDLRKNSPTYKKWYGVELSSKEHNMIYVPEGCALGFQTLEDNTELFYQMSQYYKPEFSKGIKWNDESFKISWPLEVTVISKKDQTLPLFE